MKHWTPTLSAQNHHSNNKHALKITQLKLQIGLFGANVVAAPTNDKVSIQITGTTSSTKNGTSSNSSKEAMKSILLLLPFHGTQKGRCSTHTTSTRRFFSAKAPSFAWDARDLCGFHLVLKDDGSPASLDMAFHVLYGESAAGESSNKEKMAVVGRVSMSVSTAELLAKEEKMTMKTGSNSHDRHHHHHQLQRKLPIKLRVNGLSIEATLSVSMRLTKLMNSNNDSAKPIENSVESKKRRGIIEKVKYLTSLTKEKERKKFNNVNEVEQASPYESDGSPVFDSDDSSSSNVSTTSSGSSSSSSSSRILHHNTAGSDSGHRIKNVSERLASSETKTRLDRVNRSLSQNGERSFKTKQEGLTTHSSPSTKSQERSLESHLQDNNFGSSRWKLKEISSRDGQAKLKTKVFFASFDQRSEQASGESACTVLVALIAHWLHSNKSNMPTRSQFDRLITQGSYEWRKLCDNDYYLKLFPDKHFDLETIIDANLRPLNVLPQESYTGFFSPQKFHCLKGAMSFDEIWDEINNKVVVDHEPRIYIVSWNDHFFVLKVEADAYYVIDSLGERLFEGCKQGFILKFDEFSVIYSVGGANKSEKSDHDIVCRGKECCKEFIKRFLAAIPLWQLEKEEKKGNVSSLFLHRQLQIEFHYSNLTSPLH